MWLRNFDHYPIAKPRVNNSVLPSADEKTKVKIQPFSASDLSGEGGYAAEEFESRPKYQFFKKKGPIHI